MARKKATVTIADTNVDVKQRDARKDNIPQGKALNKKTYEFTCDDCLADAMADGDMFCLYDETYNESGRCKCGKYSTHKAILI